jgi:hypothetical protein
MNRASKKKYEEIEEEEPLKGTRRKRRRREERREERGERREERREERAEKRREERGGERGERGERRLTHLGTPEPKNSGASTSFSKFLEFLKSLWAKTTNPIRASIVAIVFGITPIKYLFYKSGIFFFEEFFGRNDENGYDKISALVILDYFFLFLYGKTCAEFLHVGGN